MGVSQNVRKSRKSDFKTFYSQVLQIYYVHFFLCITFTINSMHTQKLNLTFLQNLHIESFFFYLRQNLIFLISPILIFFMHKRICLMIDDDVDKILRIYQAKLIRKNQCSISYSQVINSVLRENF